MNDLAARLRDALAAELPAATELRHRLHADPRTSGDESDAACTVAEALGSGHDVRVAGTGRLIMLGPGVPPATSVALRAELDALPVTERTGVPWAATTGAMHACGHDVHLASVVAATRAIAAAGAPIPAVALLQPREEVTPSGARDVLKSGLLDTFGVRAVIAAHVQPQLPLGTVALTPGLVNASVDEIRISVTGAGGHVGYPHTTADPVLALAAIAIGLQQVAARRVDPTRGAVCMLTEIRAGNTANIVPDEAVALGTLRLMDPADRARMAGAVGDIARSTAAAYGCSAEVRLIDGEPALVNDPLLAAATCARMAGSGQRIVTDFRSFGGDDFAHYCRRGPALMAFVGVGTPGGHGLHDGRFLPADATIATAAQVLIAGYLAACGICDG